MRSNVAGAVPTSHFENHLRSDVVSLLTEPDLKTTKREFKRSSESESNIHNDGDNILNFSSYLEEIRIQSPDTCIISEQMMRETKFGQKRKSMGIVSTHPKCVFPWPRAPYPRNLGKHCFYLRSNNTV